MVTRLTNISEELETTETSRSKRIVELGTGKQKSSCRRRGSASTAFQVRI